MTEHNEIRSKTYLFSLCTLINLGAFTSGIFFTTFNACFFQILLEVGLNEKVDNLLVGAVSGIIPFFAIFGGIFSCLLSTRFGRRRLLIITDLLSIAGAVLSQGTNITLVLVGRGICGFVCGVNFMLVPLYVREVLPYYMTKRTAVFFRTMFTLGACLTFLVSLFLVREPANSSFIWTLLCCMTIVPIVIRLVGLTFWARLDTPIYYMKKSNHGRAWEAIKKLYQDQYLDEAFRRERKMSIMIRFKEIFNREYRRQVRTALVVVLFAQLMGGNVLNFYSTRAFYGNGSSPSGEELNKISILNFFSSLVALLANIPGNIMLRRLGSKPILIYGAIALCILSTLIAFSEAVDFIVGQETLIVMFGVVQNLSFNLVASAYAYELLPSYSLIFQVVFEMLGALGMALVFPIVGVELSFLTISLMCGLGFVAVFKTVKETKGMTPREINRMFQSRERGLLDEDMYNDPDSMIWGEGGQRIRNKWRNTVTSESQITVM